MSEGPESFTCFSCGRTYKWRSQDAGRTFRCQCGIKLRCPDPSQDQDVEESLDDTVADVRLEEVFDEIETSVPEPPGGEGEETPEESPEYQEVLVPRRVSAGVFGLGPAGETLFWGVVMLVCLSSFVLFMYVPREVYLVIGVITFWGIWKFYRSWKNWSRGRHWTECLDELFSSSK
ncbi:MAG: hypothetical protein ACYTF7_01595 [Planctomycetota bacterium]|jgi:hypothetical protein